MSTVIEATYDGKVLTLVNPSDLKPDTGDGGIWCVNQGRFL